MNRLVSHRADKSFFKEKRDWSLRKDKILDYYLKPYLAKTSRLRSPILLVDGFAGPGRFEDGQLGSPLIMCNQATLVVSRGKEIRVLCIENDHELFDRLAQNLEEFEFANAQKGTFLEFVPEIAELAKHNTVFLYVDPFAITGLEWRKMATVFNKLSSFGSSVEILLNFNALAFVRAGLAALKSANSTLKLSFDDLDEVEFDEPIDLSLERLDKVAGGSWWKEILLSETESSRRIQVVVEGFVRQLKAYFQETCYVPIRKSEAQLFPKYYMIFASRHSDALQLMNDAMWSARHDAVFTMDLLADAEIPSLILDLAGKPISRGELILSVMRKEFSRLKRSEIRQYIEDLLKDGRLVTATGELRINDKVCVWRSDLGAD